MANLLIPASSGHYTDDKYVSLVEPNLWANNIFIPGVTYTDKYQVGSGGTLYVHKLGVSTLTPTAPGADFSDAIVQDSLVSITLNRQVNRSRKMYGATAAMVEYNAGAEELATALKEAATAWTLDNFQNLIETTSIIVDDNILTVCATDGSDIYDTIVNTRQKLRALDAEPDVLIVSPATMAKLLKAPEFQRTGSIGDNTISNGAVGRIAGLNVYEYSKLDSAAVDGESIGGITWATADELEYVMYDSDAFSIVTALEAVRVIDSPHTFVGSLAQVQLVYGSKLTNPSRAALKLHDASATA